jgi:kynurenine formamidase
MIQVKGAKDLEDGNYFYNGHRLEDIGGPRGLSALGPEHVGSFFTRGILIDVAALKGVDSLDKGYVITMDDFNAALEAQGIEDVKQGDVVLIRTGWNDLWRDNLEKPQDQASADNAEFNSGEPGVAPEVCDHLAENKAAMLGMDNWGIEPYDFAAQPPSDIESWGYCHANLVTRRGIYLMENMDLKQISDAVGEVEVSWRQEPAAAGRQLVLLWRERGGPEVSPPEQRSFGTRLIEDGIAYELGGQVTLEFLPPGVRCELRFPLERSARPPGHL